MLLFKVYSEVYVGAVEGLTVTQMAPEVLPPQMYVQSLIVKVTVLTKLTQRVSCSCELLLLLVNSALYIYLYM